MRKLFTFIVTLLALLSVLTCGTQGSDDEPTTKTTTAEGIVTEGSGAPVIGAAVRSSVDSAVTDMNGRFSVELPAGEVAVVRVEQPGYAPVVRRVDTPAGVDFVTVSAVMVPPTFQTVVDVSTAPATVAFPGGSVGLPQGSIQLSDGRMPDGPVEVSVTYLGPDAATDHPPVPLIGQDGSEQGQLVTFGMVDVSLSYLGESANLVAGALATITLAAESDDPPSAPFWDANLDEGLWERIGTAVRVGDVWTAEVGHFSWKNVDMFFKVPEDEQACLRFRVRDPAGNPIPGAEIKALWGPKNRYTAAGTTDVQGELCEERFPFGGVVTVQYRAFLRGEAPRWVEGQLTVVPNALGASCASVECQLVPITLACVTDAECGAGETCDAGLCVDVNEPPVTTGWMGLWLLEDMNGEDPATYFFEETLRLKPTTAINTIEDLSTGESCTTEADLTVTGDTMYFTIVTSTCPYVTDTSAKWSLDAAQDELTLVRHETEGVFVYGRLE